MGNNCSIDYVNAFSNISWAYYINNNTIVYPNRDGSRRKPKKRSNLNKKGGVYDK